MPKTPQLDLPKVSQEILKFIKNYELSCSYCLKKLSEYEIKSILIHFFRTQSLECQGCYEEMDEDTIPKEDKYDSK